MLTWPDEARNSGSDATSAQRRWTFVLDKGDDSEDDVGGEGVEEADKHIGLFHDGQERLQGS